jgi:thymidylate synthase ThyX
MKTKISATIVAHSVNEQGDELISVLATFPRIILAEVNTHRMLSKNTSSSRAIPFAKMVETIQNDPFIPIAWQKAHSGMQGTEYLNAFDSECAKEDWLTAMEYAVEVASNSNKIGVTKQLCNRLLEPFMWTTMLITGPKSGWDNFFNLRCPEYRDRSIKGGGSLYIHRSKKEFLKYDYGQHAKDFTDLEWFKINEGQAEIHIMDLAEKIYDAYNESTPRVLKAGEWHIPFENKMTEPFFKTTTDENGTLSWIPLPGFDAGAKEWLENQKVKVSVSMAARTSYTVVGEEKAIDYEAMIKLHDRLLAQDPPHSSPLEHCAKAMTQEEYWSSFGTTSQNTKGNGWCNNLKGFIPYRYLVDNGN